MGLGLPVTPSPPQVIKKNKRERDEDSLHHTDMYESHLLWFLMHHFRQRRHHRVGRGGTSSRAPAALPEPPHPAREGPLWQSPACLPPSPSLSLQRRRDPGTGATDSDSDDSPSSSDTSDEDEEGPDRVQCMPS